MKYSLPSGEYAHLIKTFPSFLLYFAIRKITFWSFKCHLNELERARGTSQQRKGEPGREAVFAFRSPEARGLGRSWTAVKSEKGTWCSVAFLMQMEKGSKGITDTYSPSGHSPSLWALPRKKTLLNDNFDKMLCGGRGTSLLGHSRFLLKTLTLRQSLPLLNPYPLC